ncbi:MAG TPA: DUF1761 domain-containing protein [Sphingomicrobium sp.]|nr:DUF1761 domain-containing protein [Sphingomicrobium sp.]
MAVVAAAVVIYVIGFVIYGLLVPEEAMSGMTEAEEATAMSRMAFGPLMPILTAVFLAVIFKWGAVGDLVSGVKWGAVIALASAIPTLLYGWVYGGGETNLTMIDVAHLWLGHVAAGAIIGGWR